MSRFVDRIGETFITKSGFKIVVIKHTNAMDYIIQFEDGTILKGVQYSNIKAGLIKKPKSKVGEIFTTREGHLITVIEYFGREHCTIQFTDGLKLEGLQYSNVSRGKVKNPYHKSVYGIGFLGVGVFKIKKGCARSSVWRNLLSRCYKEESQEKHLTYKDVTVCEEWHNFQNFAKWFEENITDKFHLDKDILIKGNKVYSPETCCFVPVEINGLFVKNNSRRGNLPIGVTQRSKKFTAMLNMHGILVTLGTFATIEEAFQAYKIAKEQYIKEMADKWRGQITEQVYQALYNYQVEITD